MIYPIKALISNVRKEQRLKAFVTGAAGFIGSNLVDRLLADGHAVTAFDNFSTGRRSFLEKALLHPDFRLIKGDVLNFEELVGAMRNCDIVFHLAANADVRFGPDHPERDLQQNTVATFNVLEAMRKSGVDRIIFSSTGSVYGEATMIPTPETLPMPVQTSLYGASKLAGEAMIQAYAESYGFKTWTFRFVGVLGERYTHGHVVDFYRQLSDDPRHLKVLGNGTQRKSYIYVQDCIEGILHAISTAREKVNIFNLGTDSFCTVKDCVKWITEELALQPEISFGTEDRGWIGDNPFIYLDTSKIRALGWSAKLTIEESIKRTVRYLKSDSEVVTSKK